jgi:hypothetical protein
MRAPLAASANPKEFRTMAKAIQFAQIQALIQNDAHLQEELKSVGSREEGVAKLVAYGRANGVAVTEAEFSAHLAGPRRLSASELSTVAGGMMKRCPLFGSSSDCTWGSCSFLTFY